MTDVNDLVAKATANLKAEAKRLRAELDQKQQAFEAEIAPARDQLRELEQAISRIEGTPGPSSARSGGRAPRGQNRERILDYLREHPESRPTDIAEKTAIGKPTAYATLAKLEKDGLLVKTETTSGVVYAAAKQARDKRPRTA